MISRTRTLFLLACLGLPFAAKAGAEDASEFIDWLLRALIVVVVVVMLLFALGFATRFLVWPSASTIKGKVAILLLVGCLAFVFWMLTLL